MKIFKIRPAVGTHETGMAFPAAESYSNYDFKSINSIYNLNPSEFPNFNPDIRFKLAKGANKCDVLSQAAISAKGLLLSERALRIITSGKSVPYKYFPGSVEINNNFEKYFWLHLLWPNGIDQIAFKNSEFYITEFGNKLEKIILNSYEDLLEKQSALGFIKIIYCSKLSIKFQNLDLFIHPLNNTIYITEKIKFDLDKNKISGLKISQAEDILFMK